MYGCHHHVRLPPGPRRSSSTSGGWRRRSKPSPTPQTPPATTRGVCPPPLTPGPYRPAIAARGHPRPRTIRFCREEEEEEEESPAAIPGCQFCGAQVPPPCKPSCPLPSGTAPGQPGAPRTLQCSCFIFLCPKHMCVQSICGATGAPGRGVGRGGAGPAPRGPLSVADGVRPLRPGAPFTLHPTPGLGGGDLAPDSSRP